MHHVRDQSGTPFEKPWPLAAWPDVPTRFLLCRDDRFFPAEFQRRVVRERLGITPDEMDGGHLPALSRPQELAERLDASCEAVVVSRSTRRSHWALVSSSHDTASESCSVVARYRTSRPARVGATSPAAASVWTCLTTA